MKKSTLLLTWTIQPNNDLKHKSTVLVNEHFFNPEYREKEYIATILYYVTSSNFDKIVFCENSWYKIKEWGNIEEIAKFYGKKIELLQFIWDKGNIIKYSYHYWEAEIFDYAFEHSKLLKETDKFFKATWRYIIHNINDLIEQYKNQDYFFYKWFGLKSTLCVTTSFFMVTKEFYKEYLYKKQTKYYQENWDLWNIFIPLESVFYNLLKDRLLKDKNKVIVFPFFHFFSIPELFLESFKSKIWLLGFGTIGRILDIFLPKIKKLLK